MVGRGRIAIEGCSRSAVEVVVARAERLGHRLCQQRYQGRQSYFCRQCGAGVAPDRIHGAPASVLYPGYAGAHLLRSCGRWRPT